MTEPKRGREIFVLPLAHHHRHEGHRCVLLPIGRHRLALCARCLGLYPTLIAVIALQLELRLGPAGVVDWWIALLGAAPALLDWGLGRLRHRGSNVTRFATGALLGVALGRSLVLYFRDPRSEVFWVQVILLAFGALAFEFVRRLNLDG